MEGEIQVPHIWSSVFASLTEESLTATKDSRLAVFGGKGTGKSTFSRWILNRLLEDVRSSSNEDQEPFILYIDLDPGQAEFTPPGVISVVKISETVRGPNHSHLSEPVLSKFVGCLNVSDCAQTYLRCAQEIFELINADESYRSVPWVINTMGFCRGLGVALACKLICLFSPSVVVQLVLDGVSGEERRSFPWLLETETVRDYLSSMPDYPDKINGSTLKPYQFVKLQSVFCDLLVSARRQVWSVNAKDLRDNVLVKYFGQVTENTDDNSITSVQPRIVPLSSVTIATMTSVLSYQDILRSMNGNLVALCHVKLPEPQQQSEDGKKMKVKVSKLPNNFYGYGIARSIDSANSLLYIITPVDEETLRSRVNCIITAGIIGLPTQLYLQALTPDEESKDLPYVMSKMKSKSKLDSEAKKQFVPKRVAHHVLTNCLL